MMVLIDQTHLLEMLASDRTLHSKGLVEEYKRSGDKTKQDTKAKHNNISHALVQRRFTCYWSMYITC